MTEEEGGKSQLSSQPRRHTLDGVKRRAKAAKQERTQGTVYSTGPVSLGWVKWGRQPETWLPIGRSQRMVELSEQCVGMPQLGQTRTVFKHLYRLLGENEMKTREWKEENVFFLKRNRSLIYWVACIEVWAWRFWKSDLSFHHLGPRDQTLVKALGSKLLNPPKHFADPRKYSL